MHYFVFQQKTAYGLRISDWSSYLCTSDRGIVDEDLRHRGTTACALDHLRPEPVFLQDVDFGVVDALAVEQPLGPEAEAAERAGIDFDLRHCLVPTGSPLSGDRHNPARGELPLPGCRPLGRLLGPPAPGERQDVHGRRTCPPPASPDRADVEWEKRV